MQKHETQIGSDKHRKDLRNFFEDPAKSHEVRFSVIPAEAGIQYF